MSKSPTTPKTIRRSRLPQLSYAIGIDSPPNFAPTAAQWRVMEEAYGNPLEAADKEKIAKLVTNYFHLGRFGRNAPFAADAQALLAKTQKAAEGARSNLGVFSRELFPDEQTENGAEFHARYRIEQHLREQRCWPEIAIEYVQEMLKDYLNAIALTAKELETAEIRGPIEEVQFAILVRGLTEWANTKTFPTGASKGAHKSPNNKPSAFVAFFHALQLTFPKEYQRHMPGPKVSVTAINLGALAKAICDARNGQGAGP